MRLLAWSSTQNLFDRVGYSKNCTGICNSWSQSMCICSLRAPARPLCDRVGCSIDFGNIYPWSQFLCLLFEKGRSELIHAYAAPLCGGFLSDIPPGTTTPNMKNPMTAAKPKAIPKADLPKSAERMPAEKPATIPPNAIVVPVKGTKVRFLRKFVHNAHSRETSSQTPAMMRHTMA